MDFLLQLFFELYLSIGEIFVPEKKFKKWQETLLKVACIIVCCVIFAFIGVGIAFLVEGIARLRVMAIVFLSAGSVMLAVQIALVVVMLVHESKKYKEEQAKKKQMNFDL